MAATLVDPTDEVDRIHAKDSGRRIGEQRCGDALAVPPVRDAPGAIDHLLVRAIEDLEGRNHRAARQRLDLELTTGQLLNALGKKLESILCCRRWRHRRLNLE